MSNNYVAHMNGDTVTQIIVADYEWVLANLEGEWHDLGGEPLTVCIGDLWDGTIFSAPTTESE